MKGLAFSAKANEIIVHPVEQCAHCHADLREVRVRSFERRQVVDVPAIRLHIAEHRAERK